MSSALLHGCAPLDGAGWQDGASRPAVGGMPLLVPWPLADTGPPQCAARSPVADGTERPAGTLGCLAARQSSLRRPNFLGHPSREDEPGPAMLSSERGPLMGWYVEDPTGGEGKEEERDRGTQRPLQHHTAHAGRHPFILGDRARDACGRQRLGMAVGVAAFQVATQGPLSSGDSDPCAGPPPLTPKVAGGLARQSRDAGRFFDYPSPAH